MNDFLKFEFWNDCDADILYSNGFKQSLYLDADFLQPDYEYEEEGTEDGDKEFKATFKKTKKTFNTEFICPEFLLQALTFMQIHDNIWIYLKTGESGKVKEITIDKDSIFSDCYNKVIMSCVIETLVSSCCKAIPCLAANHADIDGRYDFDSAQWNDPQSVPVANGRRYLFYEVGTLYNGAIYTYNRGENTWTVESQDNGDVVDFGELSLHLDGIWHEYPTVTAAGLNLTGYAIPGSFVQAQNLNGAVWFDVSDPVNDGVFSGSGIDLNPGDLVSADIRVCNYNHSCDYDCSDAIEIAYVLCENSGTFTNADLVGGKLEINHACNSNQVLYCNIIDPSGKFELVPVTLGKIDLSDTLNYVTADFGAAIGAGTFQWILVISSKSDTFDNGDLSGGVLTINHNLNSEDILYVNIIDPSNKFELVPTTIVDVDNVTVDFGGGIGAGNFRYVILNVAKKGTFTSADLVGGVLTINHSLATTDILYVNIIDPDGKFEYVPVSLVDANNVSCDLGAIGAGTFKWNLYGF